MDEIKLLLESDDYDFRYDVGISSGPRVTLAERDQIVQSLATHYTVIAVKAQLDQIVEGLKVLGVYDLIKTHPSAMYNMLISLPKKNSTTTMIDLFQQPVFSEEGSIRREQEEQIVMFWVQFLYLIEGTYFLAQFT